MEIKIDYERILYYLDELFYKLMESGDIYRASQINKIIDNIYMEVN